MPRRCTICSHPERAAIDQALIEGTAPMRVIAQRYSVSRDALRRHKTRHLAERLAEAVRRREAKAEAETDVLAAAVVRDRLSTDVLLRRLENVVQEAEELFHVAKDDGEIRDAVAALRELRASLIVLAQAVAAAEAASGADLDVLPQAGVELLRREIDDLIGRGVDPAEALDCEGLRICRKVARIGHGGAVASSWEPVAELMGEKPGRRFLMIKGNTEDDPTAEGADIDPDAVVVVS